MTRYLCQNKYLVWLSVAKHELFGLSIVIVRDAQRIQHTGREPYFACVHTGCANSSFNRNYGKDGPSSAVNSITPANARPLLATRRISANTLSAGRKARNASMHTPNMNGNFTSGRLDSVPRTEGGRYTLFPVFASGGAVSERGKGTTSGAYTYPRSAVAEEPPYGPQTLARRVQHAKT